MGGLSRIHVFLINCVKMYVGLDREVCTKKVEKFGLLPSPIDPPPPPPKCGIFPRKQIWLHFSCGNKTPIMDEKGGPNLFLSSKNTENLYIIDALA